MRTLFGLLAIVVLASGCADDESSRGGSAAGSPAAVSAGQSESSISSSTSGFPTTTSPVTSTGGSAAGVTSGDADADGGGSGAGAEPTGLFATALQIFTWTFGSSSGDEAFDEDADLDEDGVIGLRDVTIAKRTLAGLDPDPGGTGGGGGPPPPGPYVAERPFSDSAECKFCHPRQFNEWRTSPHAYSGISPTFYSLVAAGQNSIGAGFDIDGNNGVSQAGAVGNFCLPCHAPMAFIGLEGRYGGNNAGFADAQPVIPFVCAPGSPNAFATCTNQTAAVDCGAAGACIQFEGRTCVNMPPQNANLPFPRRIAHCVDDSDCAAGNNGCPSGGDDCGPCIIGPTTAYYFPEAQEGINCEACHNMQPNHQRSCQQFRNSDSVGVLSIDITERTSEDGRRLRLAGLPIVAGSDDEGCGDGAAGCVATDGRIADDTIPPVLNAFHESARVETPLVVPYNQTDRRNGVANPQAGLQIVRPTQLSCEELPYCGPGAICQGGPVIGMACSNDGDCGGCFQGVCGINSADRPGLACETSTDCAIPTNTAQNLLERAIDNPNDETIQPLARRTDTLTLDRPDGNFYRSSMMCGACHDVRPPFANAVLKSCQEQDSHVCKTDADCLGLGIGCSGDDCGPCVMENAGAHQLPNSLATRPPPADRDGADAAGQTGDPQNVGYRRVENLFTEWQISLYNHPELSYCQRNTFISCQNDADCMVNGFDEGPCSINPQANPVYGKVVTCQDCHMSNFPETALIDYSGVSPRVRDKNELYSKDLAALEGSQSDVSTPLPARRVSTHFMSGVDLPLVKFPGQQIQVTRRQQLIDSGFKIQVIDRATQPVAGAEYHVEVSVENVGVGHRFPAGFSHERQNWLQVYVQDKEVLDNLGIGANPFADNAPCNLQRTIATSAEDSRDPVGATQLRLAGCVFRSGFLLDKAHPETGELVPDGSLDDEDPEDFFVAVGTRVLGNPGDPRREVMPGTEGRALSVQYICAEETEQTYRASIAAGSGIDTGTVPDFPFQARLCDPALTPASGPGHTAPGFGNPGCMEGDADVGPCVPEIELSDGNERGRCAGDIARPSCQDDADCGNAGPCLYRCSNFPELECCDETDPTCAAYYTSLFGSANHECELESLACEGGANDNAPCLVDADCASDNCAETEICVGGSRSGLACDVGADCPGSNNCGDAGFCRIENTGIVNFQNQFRTTANGVCVDAAGPRDAEGRPIPMNGPLGGPVSCFLDLTCTLNGLGGANNVCLVNGQCSDDSDNPGEACTNVTYASDCPNGTCNVEFNLELNGRPSESVFIQNHPFNFNSMAPFQPRVFDYDFEVPAELAGKTLVVSARLMNRHFPMRFLRNLVGTQVIQPPLVFEGQGDASNPNQCNSPRSIDIDCFVAPVTTLGNAEPGGFVPAVQTVRMQEIVVGSAP